MSASIDYGGPAFPFGQVSEATGQPINNFFAPGMTLRDWFAGQALAGLTPADGYTPDHKDTLPMIVDLAVNAYQIADAMIAARNHSNCGQSADTPPDILTDAAEQSETRADAALRIAQQGVAKMLRKKAERDHHAMKPIILTGYTHHIAPIAEFCLPSKQAWAERHGCELRILRDDDFPTEHGHPSFQKLKWLSIMLSAHHRPVIWLDADSLITNPSITPESLLPGRMYDAAASRDYSDGGRPQYQAWSAGNTAWNPTINAMYWLDLAMCDEGARWGGLWDQDALQRCHPIGTLLDIRPPRIMNAVLPEFGFEASWKPGDFLIHFTGIAPEDRLAAAQKFVDTHLVQAHHDTASEPVDSPFNPHPNNLP